jgi:hypothetical protein
MAVQKTGFGIPLNCPYCGRLMAYFLSEGDWHFYDCEKCGPITLLPDGLMRRSEVTDSAVRKPDVKKHGT